MELLFRHKNVICIALNNITFMWVYDSIMIFKNTKGSFTESADPQLSNSTK